MGAAECKGCSSSDPTSDTVKVNPTLLADADGKAAASQPVQDKAQLIEEQQLEREAEEQKAREEPAAAAAAEEERQKREAEEKRKREAEQQARLERERMEERERIAREEQARAMREHEAQEQAAAEEAARRAQLEEEERARHAEERRLATELEEAKKKVVTFMRARGFSKGIAAPKKSCMKTSYVLHVAVEENSAEMVAALLKCGADKTAKNSAGLTPLALAQKLHKKKHAYSAVLAALA